MSSQIDEHNKKGPGTPLIAPPTLERDEGNAYKQFAQVAPISNSSGANTDAIDQEKHIFNNFLNLKRKWQLNPPPDEPMRVGESCLAKGALSTVIGAGMGVVVGIVFGAMGGTPAGAILMPGIPEPPRKEWRHEIRDSMRQTRYKARSWAKNFAFISGVYSGVECVVEKVRGKHDVLNSVGAGCITGAGLAVSSGPQVFEIYVKLYSLFI